MEQEASDQPVIAEKRGKLARVARLTVISAATWWIFHLVIFGLAPVSIWTGILLSASASIAAVLFARKISGMRLRPHLVLSSTTALTFGAYLGVAAFVAYQRSESLELTFLGSLVLALSLGVYALCTALKQADPPAQKKNAAPH